MPNFNTTPNMGLLQPIPGVETGPQYASDLNASLSTVDQHNHAPGNGVQINPAGININSDLPFGGNNATLLRSANFSVQGTPLSAPTDIGCLYVSGVDLWFNDESGNQIQITKNATVFASSSGISSGTASASFSSGVLVVNAASLTPANVQCGSVLIGNNVASSKFLTLQPPNAMAANFSLTLPNIPGVLSAMTLDASGNMGAITFDQVGQNMTSVGADAIGVSMSSTGANAVANTRTRATGTSVGAGGVAISSSSGSFSTTSNSFVNVTNLAVTITTTGRPIMVGLVPDGGGSSAHVGISSGNQIPVYQITDGFGVVAQMDPASSTGTNALFPPGAFMQMVFPVAGTYTYTFRVASVGSGTLQVSNCRMYAYEL